MVNAHICFNFEASLLYTEHVDLHTTDCEKIGSVMFSIVI